MLKYSLIHFYHPEHNCTFVSIYLLANIARFKNTITSDVDNRICYEKIYFFLFLKYFDIHFTFQSSWSEDFPRM